MPSTLTIAYIAVIDQFVWLGHLVKVIESDGALIVECKEHTLDTF